MHLYGGADRTDAVNFCVVWAWSGLGRVVERSNRTLGGSPGMLGVPLRLVQPPKGKLLIVNDFSKCVQLVLKLVVNFCSRMYSISMLVK